MLYSCGETTSTAHYQPHDLERLTHSLFLGSTWLWSISDDCVLGLRVCPWSNAWRLSLGLMEVSSLVHGGPWMLHCYDCHQWEPAQLWRLRGKSLENCWALRMNAIKPEASPTSQPVLWTHEFSFPFFCLKRVKMEVDKLQSVLYVINVDTWNRCLKCFTNGTVVPKHYSKLFHY